MTIGKDTRVFKINRTNKTSIKEDINILGFSALLDYFTVSFITPHHTTEKKHLKLKTIWF
jgi:hypothetical protein